MNFASMTDQECKAYNDAIRHAARRANDDKGASYSVWRDGATFFVRPSKGDKPEGAKLVCIAQFWSSMTHSDGHESHRIQLRFDGAWSEWVDF